MSTKYNLDLLRDLINNGIRHGAGCGLVNEVNHGDVCIEQAVALASGHRMANNMVTDAPSCTFPSISWIAVALNDSKAWSSPKARGNGLRKLAYAQLGTANDYSAVAEFNPRKMESEFAAELEQAIDDKAKCLGIDEEYMDMVRAANNSGGFRSMVMRGRHVADRLRGERRDADADKLLGMVADMAAAAIRRQGVGLDPPEEG